MKLLDEILHSAAAENALQTVVLLLKRGADINATLGGRGETILHLAVQKGYTELVKLLLSHGADVNAKDMFGSTALHYAAKYDAKRIAELLLANGAKVNAKNNTGWTPLTCARNRSSAEAPDTETAALLRKHGGKFGAELK